MSPLPQNFFNHDAQAGGFFPLAHVGIQIESIGNKQNTIIEGIRGTGKTHLLKMLRRHHLSNFSNKRVLPVYVSLAEISEHAKKDPDEFRVHLYARIVSTAIETLEASKHHLSPNRGIVKGAVRMMLRGFGLDKYFGFEDIDKNIEEVKSVADELLFKLSYDISAADLKTYVSTSQATKRQFGIDAEATVAFPVPVSAKIRQSNQGNSEQASSESAEETVKILGSRLAHKNASQFMIGFLQQLQVILDLDYSLILLDECSEAGRESQVEIFRFFKAIRGANSTQVDKEDCAFFVGSVYPSAETHYPNRDQDGFSFEPGQDCGVEFIQWDETDPETYIKFFEQMLLARANAVIGFEGSIASFISKYYDGRKTFNLLAYCAGGTPRRFWELNKRAYDSGTNRVSYTRLKIAVQEIVNEQILGHSTLTDDDHKIVQHVIRVLKRKNDEARSATKINPKNEVPQGIYFSISHENALYLGRLIMQGAIYDKSRMKTRRHSLRPHPIFALDTGVAFSNFVIPEKGFDLIAEKEFPKSTANGFASAASFEPTHSSGGRAWDIGAIFSSRPIEAKSGRKVLVPAVRQKGIIKRILPNGNAFVAVLDGGPDAFVNKSQMVDLIRHGAVEGSAIEMTINTNDKGRQASNITINNGNLLENGKKITEDIRQYVEDLVASEGSVVLARVAHELRNHFGDELGDHGWRGYQKLSQLLISLSMKTVWLDFETPPGYARKKSKIREY